MRLKTFSVLILTLPLTLVLSIFLSGCLGDLVEVTCMFTEDDDHCYQAVAIQEGEPETCEKIEGKDFKYSNPPKDKCYLTIAENTGDLSACEEMEGGLMSYSSDECIKSVLANHTVDDCKQADDEMKCRSAYGAHGKGCGDEYVYNKQKKSCDPKPETPEGKGADDDIESKAEQDLTTIKDAATGKYMELLEKAIEEEEDEAKKLGLEKYKEFLEKSGQTLETVQTTVDQLKEIKRIFLDAYDPSMAIDKMPVNKILEQGLFDRIKEKLFGADEPTPRSRAEDALSVYEAMLKRQEEIDFLQKGRLDRLKDVVVSKAKDEATSQLKEKVTTIAEGIAGTAFATVGIVDHALSSFQEAAQKEMFVGLAAAYNRRREALMEQNPNLSPEEIHKRTVAQVKDDPYQDNPNTGFVKYGNLIENKDCQDESNPLCIDNRVFWTAMDKTYDITHKKK